LIIREVPLDSHFVNAAGLTKLGAAIQFVYCAISALLVFDYNIGPWEVFSTKQSPESSGVTMLSMCIHGVLLSTMVFIQVNPASMSQVFKTL
jgi:hypothetical protein